jgi:hypothetical protein
VLTISAKTFASGLLAQTFRERKNNREIETTLRVEDVRLLVSFFFSDVFGDGARQRLYQLIDELSADHTTTADPSPSDLAAQQVANASLLPEVRNFFAVYSTWHQGEVEETRLYPVIMQTIRSHQLYLAFAQLRATASGPHGHALRSFLAEQGFTQSRGVDIRTCILRYLSHELRTPLGRLNNVLQAQLGIYHIVQQFGPGVLVLLPRVASYRITRFGVQKIQDVLRQMRPAIPGAVDCCSLAEANILQPILRGEPLPPLMADRVASRPTLSLAETLTAVTPREVTELRSETMALLEQGDPSAGPSSTPASTWQSVVLG